MLSWTDDKKQQIKQTCYEVMLHKLCNEKCLFCSQEHETRLTAPKPSDADIFFRILQGKKQWYQMLWFTWWEPLIHPKIVDYVKFASKIWFDFIRIQTNGVMLHDENLTKNLVDAWVTFFKLSIHHYIAEKHNKLVWLPWAFEKVMKWVEYISKLWARIWVNMVVTKENYKDLVNFCSFFLDKWARDFVIILPLYEGNMGKEWKKIWVKFTDTVPYIIDVLHFFDSLWLKRPLILNLPLCLLPWYENAIIQTFNWTAVLNLDGTKTNIDDNKLYLSKEFLFVKIVNIIKCVFE